MCESSFCCLLLLEKHQKKKSNDLKEGTGPRFKEEEEELINLILYKMFVYKISKEQSPDWTRRS